MQKKGPRGFPMYRLNELPPVGGVYELDQRVIPLDEWLNDFLRDYPRRVDLSDFEPLDEFRRTEKQTNLINFRGRERKLFRSFIELDPADESAIQAFANKHRTLLAGPYGFVINEDTGTVWEWEEPVAFWKWHIKRMRFVLRLYEILSDGFLRENRPEGAKKAILQVLEEHPVKPLPSSLTEGPWSSLTGHKDFFRFSPRNEGSNSPVEYCPEQELLRRPTFEERSTKLVLTFAQAVVDHVISKTIAATCIVHADRAGRKTTTEPRNMLGLLYEQLYAITCSAQIQVKVKICPQCGESFKFTRSYHQFCCDEHRKKYWYEHPEIRRAKKS